MSFQRFLRCLSYCSFFVFLSACSDDSNRFNPPTVNPPATQNTIETSRVLLGPIIDADVNAALASDVGTIIETAMTNATMDLDIAGGFEIALTDIADDTFVLVTISGGSDIDVDDNGEIDGSPTVNQGSFRGLATASQWRSGINITAVSEVLVRALVGTDSAQLEMLSNVQITEALNNSAQSLLRPNVDTNNDGLSNYEDLLDYSPYTQEPPTVASHASINALAQAIESGAADNEVDVLIEAVLAPLAVSAGEDMSVNEGVLVNLASTITPTPGVSVSSITWRQLTGPSVILQNSNMATASFTAPQVTMAGASLTFEVEVIDANNQTASNTIDVGVIDIAAPPPPANIPPSATAQMLAVNSGDTLNITLAGTDADGTITAFSIATQPTNGTLTGVTPNLSYTPNAGFDGADQFTFNATDDDNATSTNAAITITVNPVVVANMLPTALPQSLTTDEDIGLDIVLEANDSDGTIVTFNTTTMPVSGTLSGIAPNLVYTPTLNFNGTDQFSFTATDNNGGVSPPVTINLNINPINDAPAANAGANQQVDSASNVTLNGDQSTDVEDDTNLQFQWAQSSGPTIVLNDANTSGPSFTAPDSDSVILIGVELTVVDSAGAQSTDEILTTIHPIPDNPSVSGTTNASFDLRLTSPDGRFKLIVPAGAVATDTLITMRQNTRSEINSAAPENGSILDALYSFSPANVAFSTPAQITYLVDSNDEPDEVRGFAATPDDMGETSISEENYNREIAESTANLSVLPLDIATSKLGLSLSAGPPLFLFVGETDEFHTSVDASSAMLDMAQSPVESDIGFGAKPASASESVISTVLTSPLQESMTNELYFASGEVTCNDVGQDHVLTRYIYSDRLLPGIGAIFSVLNIGPGARGLIELASEVNCRTLVISEFIARDISLGNGPEAFVFDSPPPYPPLFGIDNTTQRVIATSQNQIDVLTIDGDLIESIPRTAPGALFGTRTLSHSNGTRWRFSFGADGKEVFPNDNGFGFIDTPPNLNHFTSDAQLARDANGNRVSDNVWALRNGKLESTREEGAGLNSSADLLFDGEAGQLPDTAQPLFTCDSLSPSFALCATEDGFIYSLNLIANTVLTLQSNTAGSGIRDLECSPLNGQGLFGCAAVSFTNETITYCSGTAGAANSFSCGSPIASSNGVTIGVATTEAGNLAVVVPDFTQSSIFLHEIAPDGSSIVSAEIPNSSILTLPGLENSVLTNPGHADIDARSNTIIISGNASGNGLILPIDLLVDLPEAPSGLAQWFQP